MAFRKIEYSSYQKDIFNEVENGHTNIAINAVAGSGKTTTIVMACKRLKLHERDVKFLAFNKLIAEELKERLKGYADVSTMHAFGLSILREVYGGAHIKVDSWKCRKYVKENLYSLSSIVTPSTDAAKVYGFCCNVDKLFALARVNLIQHGDVDALQRLCDEHNLITLFDEVKVVNILLADAYKMPANFTIDYTDMIVLPLFHVEHIPHYKFVFIDECQDLNRAQRELMLQASKGGRFVAVGDRNQAINGFAGADCQSFDKISMQPHTTELPLSVNYRCGTSMIKLAKEIVPQIEAHNGAQRGEISHIKEFSTSMFGNSDMVICRTTAPLVGLCMKMIESGITAVVKGKDIAQDLKNIVEKSNARTMEELLDYLKSERQMLANTIKKDRKCSETEAKESGKYIAFDDRCKCIENICQYHTIKDVRHLNGYINTIFSDDRMDNAVTLSTIHKAKGLEANKVFILLPNKLPLTWRGQLDWQLQQEINLKYVALTRARKELVFVDMEEKELETKQIARDAA